MKSKAKHLNIIVSMLLLIVAVFSAINVSYSYFTSKASKSGDIKMGALSTYIRYRSVGSGISNKIEGEPLKLYSAEDIEIGVEFNVARDKYNNGTLDPIEDLSIVNDANSCDCYVRFWIEAYVVKDDVEDKNKDYGRFFAIQNVALPQGQGIVRGGLNESYCYFVKKPLAPGAYIPLYGSGNFTLILEDLMNETTLVEAVPTEILGENVRIYLSFEAVQNANEAFKSVFNDNRKWYSKWT